MFYSQRNIRKKLKEYFHGCPVQRVFKYLGLWFDSKYTWKKHIDYVGSKCKSVLNVMRAIVRYSWGADRESLLSIHRALIRFVLDYCCMVKKTSVNQLDWMQYRGCALVHFELLNKCIFLDAAEMPLALEETN